MSDIPFGKVGSPAWTAFSRSAYRQSLVLLGASRSTVRALDVRLSPS